LLNCAGKSLRVRILYIVIMAVAWVLPVAMLVAMAMAQSCKANDALCKEASSDGFQQLLQVEVAKKESAKSGWTPSGGPPTCARTGENAWWPSSREGRCCDPRITTKNCDGTLVCLGAWQACPDWTIPTTTTTTTASVWVNTYCAHTGEDAWWPASREGRCCDSSLPTKNCDGTLVCLAAWQACPDQTIPTATTNPNCAPCGEDAWSPSSRQGKCCDGGATTNCAGTLYCLSAGQACPS